MLKKFSIGAGALAMGLASLTPVAAHAQNRGYYGYDRGYNDDSYRDHDRAYRRAARDGWNRDPYYNDGGRYYRDNRGYSYNRRCNDGTVGTVVGALAGGLLGRTIDTRGDRTLGTVLGGAAGALAGNAVGKSNNPGYCRR